MRTTSRDSRDPREQHPPAAPPAAVTVTPATAADEDDLRQVLSDREAELRPGATVQDHLTQVEETALRFLEEPDRPEPANARDLLQAREEAERQVTREMESHFRQQADRERRVREEMTAAAATGRRVRPILAGEDDSYLDETVPVDRDGNVMHFTGPNGEPMVGRWVRLSDPEGRPSTARAGYFRRHGYYAPKDPLTGKPITNQFGLYMVTTPQDEGARRAHHMKGLVSLEEFEEKTVDGLADELNSRAGRKIGTVVRDPERHGRTVRGPLEQYREIPGSPQGPPQT